MAEITREFAIAQGVDLSAHECGCEFCMRTSALCPATQSSIAEELGLTGDEPDGHDCESPNFDPEWHTCEACVRAEREREAEHYARMNVAWAEAMGPALFPEEHCPDCHAPTTIAENAAGLAQDGPLVPLRECSAGCGWAETVKP